MKSNAVIEKIAAAKSALEYFDGRIYDGDGQFTDRSTATFRLRSAIEELEAAAGALKKM